MKRIDDIYLIHQQLDEIADLLYDSIIPAETIDIMLDSLITKINFPLTRIIIVAERIGRLTEIMRNLEKQIPPYW